MKTTVDFLDAVKTKNGLTSDYQLSKHLACTHSAISNYRMKKNYLDEAVACKIADDLGLEPSYVLACIASERAKKPEVKAAWAHAAEVLYGIAAVVTLTWMVLPINSIESSYLPASFVSNNIHYAKYITYWAILSLLISAMLITFPWQNPRSKK